MIYKLQKAPDEIELYYNKEAETFTNTVGVTPFIYKDDKDGIVNRLVLIWSASIVNSAGDTIVNYKVEFDYLIHPGPEDTRSLEVLKKLLNESCKIFSQLYDIWSAKHRTRLKNIYKNYIIDGDLEELFHSIYDK